MLLSQTLPTDMAEAAESERPTKRQRLTEELEPERGRAPRPGDRLLRDMHGSLRGPRLPAGQRPHVLPGVHPAGAGGQPRCPLSNAQITIPRRGGVDAVLDGNHQVRSMINSQPVTCKYASHGCTARPALEAVDAHEATCPHKPVACSHERCSFVGSRVETAAHEKVCPFVLLGPVLDAQALKIRSLEGDVRRLKEANEATQRLQARLDALEAARPHSPRVASAPAPERRQRARGSYAV